MVYIHTTATNPHRIQTRDLLITSHTPYMWRHRVKTSFQIRRVTLVRLEPLSFRYRVHHAHTWAIANFFFRKTILSHFMFSSHFMLFPTFTKIKIISGVVWKKNTLLIYSLSTSNTYIKLIECSSQFTSALVRMCFWRPRCLGDPGYRVDGVADLLQNIISVGSRCGQLRMSNVSLDGT